MRIVCHSCSMPIVDRRFMYDNEQVRHLFRPMVPLYRFCNRAHYMKWWDSEETQKRRQQRELQNHHLKVLQGGKE